MVKTLELERILLSMRLFEGMARAQLVWLISLAEHVELARSETLFERGTHIDRFYVLLHGHVKFSMSGAQDQEKVVEIFGAGHTFGESVLLPRQRWIGTAQALTASRLLALKRDDLIRAMRQSHDLSIKLLTSVSQRLESLLLDIESVSFRSAAQRVADYVLQLPRSDNEAKLQFPKRTIASKLGLQPETFSRSLKRLATDGLITVKGPKIVIHDAVGLANLDAT